MEAQRELEFNISTVDHWARRIIGTDCNGYCLLHLIYKWSYNHLNTSGWCYASKDKLGETIGISRATTYRYIKEFEEAGYLRKQPGTGQIQTTEKFNQLLEKGVETDSLKMRQIPSQNETQYNTSNNTNTPYSPPKGDGHTGKVNLKSQVSSNGGEIITFPSDRDSFKASSSAACRKIIDDLNALSGKSFLPTCKATQRLIFARLKEGRKVDDFLKVHRNKKTWVNDPEMDKYFRPQTLYAAQNFESYLNEKPPVVPGHEPWRYGI